MLNYLEWIRDRYDAQIPEDRSKGEFLKLHYLQAERIYRDFHGMLGGDRIKELERQRDELVAALRLAGDEPNIDKARAIADKALASVKDSHAGD